jgi:hypothetical protein
VREHPTRAGGIGLVAGARFRVIALDDLIVNKRAAARPQDLVDADALVRVGARRPRA